MATRHLIDRLSERTEAVIARLRPPGRIFHLEDVQNYRNADAEFAAFRRQRGLTDDDVVIARCVVPWEDRPADWNEPKPGPRFEYKGNVLFRIQLVRPRRQWGPADFEREKRSAVSPSP